MNLRLAVISLTAALSLILLGGRLASAETVAPASKCVTTATKATHASALARMEKDIAPYLQIQTGSVGDVMKSYRDDMDIAWEAMNEPYCGYGSYGTASAIKSYTKSIDRARATFLTAIKTAAKGKVVGTATPTTAPAPVQVATPPSAPVQAPVVVATPVAPLVPASGSITVGLEMGKRTPSVLLLQKKLTTYYKITDASMLTGYFGPKTDALVKRFQVEKKLVASTRSYGAGYVGVKTAAALNNL